MDKKDIASYNLEELTQEMKTLGEKPFRARQIYAWLHQKLAGDFQEMTDLSILSQRRTPRRNFSSSLRTATRSRAC